MIEILADFSQFWQETEKEVRGQKSALEPFEIDLQSKLIPLRGEMVMLDSDVANVYGVETKHIYQAVRNNPEKFPIGYVIEPNNQEIVNLRSKILTSSSNYGGARYTPKLFTEKGLYMLATILKGDKAIQATLAIIETYAKVRELQRGLTQMHQEKDPDAQKSMMKQFGEILSDIVIPELQTSETESSLELNFFIGKLKHTVKRKRVEGKEDEVE